MKKVIFILLLSLFCFYGTASAEVVDSGLFSSWSRLDSNKIVFFTGGYAVCVMEIDSYPCILGTEKINFENDMVSDFDNINIDGSKYMISKITNL